MSHQPREAHRHPPPAARSALPPVPRHPQDNSSIQDPGSRIQHPASSIQDPESSTRHPGSGIQSAGLYIHVPFCLKKCRYCDFASCADLSLQHRYADAVCREMEWPDEPFSPFDTLYIGGGTPTAVEADLLLRILESALSRFSFEDTAEVTVEANPGTVSFDLLRRLRRAGVNRINLGIQSFSDANLGFLGRIHSSRQAEDSIFLAREAGFDNVGVDLIYGLPGQKKDAWQKDLQKALSFSPEHLSAYMLTFEPGTPLADELSAGRIAAPEEGTVADLFCAASEVLRARGYVHYEISNFARSLQHRSRHNRKYWSLAPTLGLGPSAHSYLPDPPLRWWNRPDPAGYTADVERGVRPVAGEESLTFEQRITEAIFLGLRTAEGIGSEAFFSRFGVSLEERFGELLRELAAEGLLRRTGRSWAPSLKGMLFADYVAGKFVERL